MNAWFLLACGLLALVAGAELLVRGAATLASRLGISPLVVGLTVVGFGTSSPEIAVSLSAVVDGQPDLALGNAVGSNSFNVLFILGLSAVVRPLLVQQKLVRIEVPLIILAGVVLWLMLSDDVLGRLDGFILLAGILGYTAFAIRNARHEAPEVEAEYDAVPGTTKRGQVAVALAFVVAGVALTVLGAHWLVEGAVTIAQSLGVGELVIGLTIVAAGTSLPELATSVVAAFRGQQDIAVGNILGSNLFNILGVLGLAGVAASNGLPASPALMAFDLPVMIAVSVACLPILFTGYRIDRWEGGLFLLVYAAYIAYLLLEASTHDAIGGFAAVVLWFALPADRHRSRDVSRTQRAQEPALKTERDEFCGSNTVTTTASIGAHSRHFNAAARRAVTSRNAARFRSSGRACASPRISEGSWLTGLVSRHQRCCLPVLPGARSVRSSSSFCLNCLRARCSLDQTVPIGIPSTAAISMRPYMKPPNTASVA
jgi:cation:H+ antiporter